MPVIKKTVDIKASPESVFDLIARPEDFPRYSSFVKKVTAIGHLVYHWIVDIYGVEFEWDAKVVELIKPKRFAWQSITGIQNSGSYTLKPIANGTRVTFFMEYLLPNIIMEELAHVITEGYMDRMASEILEHVKKELEP